MVQAYPSPCVKVVIRVSLCDEHQYILSTIIFVTISVLLEVRYYKCVTGSTCYALLEVRYFDIYFMGSLCSPPGFEHVPGNKKNSM